ncbi:MAG: 30S ribosome-binding factor RbfA [Chloroflexi bacterium]|nr:30S ribosome-binding factor RbfA [Chloroflexota bacterium]
MARRIDRVNALLRQEISRVIATELRDPRLSSLVSVLRVQTSPDLRQAAVYISVLGGDDEKKDVMRALRSASGYVHRAIRDNLTLKTVPHLEFRLDDSIERTSELLELIDRYSSGQPSAPEEAQP